MTTTRSGVRCWSIMALVTAVASSPLQAQRRDTLTTRPAAPVTRRDTSLKTTQADRARLLSPRKPPLTPRRAFVYSLFVPGLGQSRLNRGSAGAFFAAIELASWAMVRKSGTDLRESRRYSGDSVPNNYIVKADGTLGPDGSFPNSFPVELVNTRRLHVEDWYAALAFNHLIAGADAFVAAQLWDVPASVSVRPRGDGVAVVATVRW